MKRLLKRAYRARERPSGHKIIRASPRTGQKLVGELLRKRLLISDSPKGRLRLAFPAEAAGHYFPNLYPAGLWTAKT